MRLLVGLMALGAGYFGWQWYCEQPSEADASGSVAHLYRPVDEGGDAPATAAQNLDRAEKPAVAKTATATSPAPLQARSEDRLVRGILTAHDSALKIGFRELQAAAAPARAKILEALSRAAATANDIDARLRLLGDGNAFLHSGSGRKLLHRVLLDIQRMDREKGIVKSTTLLEKCMRGPIAKSDQAAYEAVNAAYRVHLRLVDQVTFSPTRMTKARSYKVKPGDVLDRIARRFRRQGILVDGWTLCFVNRIGRPNLLQAGKTIKIPVEPIWAKLEKESFLFAVYIGKTIVRLYWVGHGGEECSTPETTFTVAEKLTNPDWSAPDGETYPFGHPKNVLGRHFVKFGHESLHGFGAHGTTEPETIRTRSSLGCIRMRGQDIEEFSRLFPRGCKVVVAASR